jgi:hypothetical protein
MRTIRVETEIAAPPSVVWDVLTDLDALPEWNPFLTSVDGTLAVGSRLRVRIEPPGGRAMTFRPRVRRLEPGRLLEWLGRVGVPGVLDGRHRFELEEMPGGRTRFVHAETLTGVLVPLMGGALRRTEAGFAAMNEALRQRSEDRVRSAP